MAHYWVMKYGKVDSNYNRENTVQLAWDYADAMQAEADKRKLKGLPDVLKLADSPQLNNESILHNIDCYFDNANNTKRDADNLIQSIYEHLTGEVKVNAETTDVSEWQPDWSQAPDGYDWWAIDRDGFSCWHKSKPNTQSGIYFWIRLPTAKNAPSFNYQGDWEDSLRKRPNT